MKVRLTIAYEGTGYAGWQFQKNAVSVQQRIEEALAHLLPDEVRLYSSSRTDTGVHAVGMVAHLEISQAELRMPIAKLQLALNAHLPDDIRVVAAKRAPSTFHARFDATGKQYRYYVWNHFTSNPMLRRHAWLVHNPLNIDAMRHGARYLLGKNDFVSFAGTRDYKMESTVRRLSRCDVKRSGLQITFVIEADGFLYKMCRGIVGTLVQIGQGKFAPEDIEWMLARKDRRAAGMTAPAHGLVLWKVFYGSKPRNRNEHRSR